MWVSTYMFMGPNYTTKRLGFPADSAPASEGRVLRPTPPQVDGFSKTHGWTLDPLNHSWVRLRWPKLRAFYYVPLLVYLTIQTLTRIREGNVTWHSVYARSDVFPADAIKNLSYCLASYVIVVITTFSFLCTLLTTVSRLDLITFTNLSSFSYQTWQKANIQKLTEPVSASSFSSSASCSLPRICRIPLPASRDNISVLDFPYHASHAA